MSDIPDLQAQLLPGERERPTLKTIARIAGLAVPTVSRALSDAPDIGSNTKKRVRALADQLGYRPNRAGLRLRTGKTNVIALVFRTEDEVGSHGSRLVTAAATELRSTPYHAIFFPYFPDEDPLTPLRYIVRTGSADGIILNRIQPDDSRIEFLQDRKIPFAMHGRTRNCENIPWFDFDNAEYARIAVSRIAERGRRKLLLVAPPRDQNYSRLMIAGAEEAGARLGVTVSVSEDTTSDMTSEHNAEAIKNWFAQHPETDAIMTASGQSALAACLGAEAQGRKIGKDFDLVAKETIPMLQAFRKDIIAVREDIGEAGAFLARAVLRSIDEPNEPPLQKLVTPT